LVSFGGAYYSVILVSTAMEYFTPHRPVVVKMANTVVGLPGVVPDIDSLCR